MSNLLHLVEKSQNSNFYKKILNFILSRTIPFNAPHHFNVIFINKGVVTVHLPYRRSNLNHVKGIHACALATLCEFTTGLALLTMISEKDHRIILKSLKLEYHYQARMNVAAHFELTEQFISDNIANHLQTKDAVFTEFKINVYDDSKNHICTGYVNWQIKKWTKVSTAV